MKCNLCGNNVAENTTFCPYCGSAIKKEVIKEQASGVVEMNQNNTNVNSEGSQSVSVPENVNAVVSEQPIINEQPNIVVPQEVNKALAQEQPINNEFNYNANNMYNMQNYQSINTQSGYVYNNMNNNSVNYNNQYSINNNASNYAVNNNQVEDKASVGLAILSWFIPLVGIILFFTKKKTSPKTSKVCGIVALIAIILTSIVTFIGVMKVNDIFQDLMNTNEYDTEEEYDDYPSTSNIWESYEVEFNSEKIKLPCSYNEFVNTTNYKLKSEKEGLILKNYYYDIINVYSNDKLAGIISVYNKSGSDAMYKNANVSRISQSKYNVETNEVDKFIFPGKLYAGMEITKDEVIKTLGKPAKENETEYNGIKTYNLKYTTKESYTTSGYYEIVIIGDEINELTLDNRP